MLDDETVDLFERLIAALEDPMWTDWVAALAAIGTFVVAVWALIYAGVQVREAKRSREQARELEVERAQPYVVAYMEPSEASLHFIELVVRNFGVTAARNVRIEIDPWPKRSIDPEPGGEVQIPKVIPILAPGQEWRSLWDNSQDRLHSSLPDAHTGRVLFTGVGDRELESPVLLDWSIYKARRWVGTYGQHDAAKALREIRRLMRKWNEGATGPLSVVVRDGAALDEHRRAQFEAWKSSTRIGSTDAEAPNDGAQ